MASQVEQIGRAFIQHYYTVFDKDRSQLLPLYVSDNRSTGERPPTRLLAACGSVGLTRSLYFSLPPSAALFSLSNPPLC